MLKKHKKCSVFQTMILDCWTVTFEVMSPQISCLRWRVPYARRQWWQVKLVSWSKAGLIEEVTYSDEAIQTSLIYGAKERKFVIEWRRISRELKKYVKPAIFLSLILRIIFIILISCRTYRSKWFFRFQVIVECPWFSKF